MKLFYFYLFIYLFKNSTQYGIKLANGLSYTFCETQLVKALRAEKRDFYLPHPSSPPYLIKLPFEFSDGIRIIVKIWLYESLVILTLLYGAESWPLFETQMKQEIF